MAVSTAKSQQQISMENEKTVIAGTFEPKFHECRPGGEIYLHALVRYLQEMATHHADILGCGFYDLIRRDGYWVLSNIRIKVSDLPRYQCRFTIKTWPSRLSRLLAEREFIVCDSAGKELVRASSEWLVMHAKSNRPVNLLALDLNLPQKPEKVFNSALKRLKAVPTGHSTGHPTDLPTGHSTEPSTDRAILRLTVPYSALDVNGHVNNAQYVKWTMDAIHNWAVHLLTVADLQITYLSEVFEKNEIEICLASDNRKNHLVISGINRSTGKTAFNAAVVFRV